MQALQTVEFPLSNEFEDVVRLVYKINEGFKTSGLTLKNEISILKHHNLVKLFQTNWKLS